MAADGEEIIISLHSLGLDKVSGNAFW